MNHAAQHRMMAALRRLGMLWKNSVHIVVSAIKQISPRRIAIGTAALLVIIQVTILGMNSLRPGQPVLGLQLENQLVGTLYNRDFHAQVVNTINAYETKNFTVRAAQRTSTTNLRELGVKTDARQLSARLLTVGRSGTVLSDLAEQNTMLAGRHTIRIGQPGFDDGLARKFVATLNDDVHIAPVNATFAYENQKAIVRSDQPGRAIDTEAAVSLLHQVNPLVNKQVVLPIAYPQAAITKTALMPLLPEVQAIAQKPLSIEAGNSKVVLSPTELISLVTPKPVPDAKNPDKTTMQIAFDESKMRVIIDGVVKQAVFAPKPKIMNGSVVMQEGASGLRVQESNTLQYVLAVLDQRQKGAGQPDAARIPLVTIEPPVIQQTMSDPRLRTGTGSIRLTFDDGPSAYTEQVLNILNRYNVRATFYLIGRDVRRYPGTVQRIVNEGHRVGNHSFSHANLAYLSRAGVVQDLQSTQDAIRAVSSVTPTAFRPPYGSVNHTVREVASSMGLSIDLWSVDPQDWTQPGAGAITQRVLRQDGPGAVILLHSIYKQTVDALPGIIEGIRAQGYRLE